MPKNALATAARSTQSDTRGKILDLSAQIFRVRGYTDTTMNHIAEAAGIKAASIYYYFKSKDEIVEEVLNLGTLRVFEAVRQAIDALPDEISFREKIAVALRTHLMLLHTQGDYTAANIRLFPEAPEVVIKRHMTVRRSYGRYWQEMLREGQAQGAIAQSQDIEITQMLLLGALNWSLQWYKPSLHKMEDVTTASISLLLDGLLHVDETAANCKNYS